MKPQRARSKKEERPSGMIAAVVVAFVIAAAIAIVQVMPLFHFVPGAQRALSERLQQPVTVSRLRYAFFPSPGLVLERVVIGKLDGIKVQTITVPMSPFALFAEIGAIQRIEANGITLEADSVPIVAAWLTTGRTKLQVSNVVLKGVRAPVKGLDNRPFDAQATFDAEGRLQSAVLSDSKVKLNLTPKDKGMELSLTAREWRMPWGPEIEFDDLSLTGVVAQNSATVNSLEARIGSAQVKGGFKANWDGALGVAGDFNIANASLRTLMPTFTREFSAAGTLTANGRYSLRGSDVAQLFNEPRVEASFGIVDGELNNVDLTRGIQSPSANGVRGGKTRFDKLTGTLQVNGNRYTYRDLSMSSAGMTATGNIGINADGALTGRVNVQLGSKGVSVGRGMLNVVGTVRDPVLKP